MKQEEALVLEQLRCQAAELTAQEEKDEKKDTNPDTEIIESGFISRKPKGIKRFVPGRRVIGLIKKLRKRFGKRRRHRKS